MSIIHKPFRAILTVAFSFGAALSANIVSAADMGLTLEGGVGRSDNIARTTSNEIEEDLARAGFEFTLQEATEKINADVAARAMRMSYLGDTFQDETLSNFSGVATFQITDTVFSWMVADDFGQQIVDPFSPVRPNNRENINFFTTGPDFLIPFSERSGLNMDMRYSTIRYEFRNQDNDRASANLRLFRQLNESRQLALSTFAEKIEYKDTTVNTDLNRYHATVRYLDSSTRNDVSIDIGWNWIEVEDELADGLFANISVSREVSTRGTLSLKAGSEFSEAGNLFRLYNGLNGRSNTGTVPPDDSTDVQNTSDPFTFNYARLLYNFGGQRTQWGIAADWADESYETRTDLDRTIFGIYANVSRQVSRSIVLFANAYRRDRDYGTLDRLDKDTMVVAGVSWGLGARWGLQLDYGFFKRDSSVANNSYDENRAFLTVRYTAIQ